MRHRSKCYMRPFVMRHCMPQIITMGLLDLAQYILTFGERPGQAPKLPKNLELTGSYSILVQAFVALHAPGAPSTTSHIMASYRELVAAVIKCVLLHAEAHLSCCCILLPFAAAAAAADTMKQCCCCFVLLLTMCINQLSTKCHGCVVLLLWLLLRLCQVLLMLPCLTMLVSLFGCCCSAPYCVLLCESSCCCCYLQQGKKPRPL